MKKLLLKLMTFRPGVLMLLAYLAAITIGALLLLLPFSQKEAVSFLDCLFTATSAVCVTGLVTVDTATVWTFWGQLIILGLIQLGGLGIMTIATMIFASAGRRVSSGERLFFHESLATGKFHDLWYLLKRIFAFTIIIQLLGAAIIFFGFLPRYSFFDSVWYALFHALSSFNNAGFSLFTDNLVGQANNMLVVWPVMLLIVLGGLGYFVMIELTEWHKKSRHRISIHTRSVVWVTLTLIVAGALGIYIFGGINFKDSLFQSVTARTAGYNTVLLDKLPHASIIILMILMFIGASPGSTGGGVKTTSFLLVISLAVSRLFGHMRVSLFKRTVPQVDIVRAVGVFVLGIMVVVIGAFGVVIFQPANNPLTPDIFKMALFEIISALGTVGLSLGLTPQLSAMSKVIVIVTMLIGKVGVLTVAHGLAARKGRKEIIYAEESIMIG